MELPGKLWKLKKWFTVPHAARHLSTVFEEDVNESDILRLALDRQLQLSVNFVNGVSARCGKIVSEEDTIFSQGPLSPEVQKRFGERSPELTKLVDELKALIAKSIETSSNPGNLHYVDMNDEIIIIAGVWDLPMTAGDGLEIGRRYEQLTGGPELDRQFLDGVCVTREDGSFCQLLEKFDEDALCRLEEESVVVGSSVRHHTEKNKKKQNLPDDYFPAVGLPKDCVLVVRTSALTDLLARMGKEEHRALTHHVQEAFPISFGESLLVGWKAIAKELGVHPDTVRKNYSKNQTFPLQRVQTGNGNGLGKPAAFASELKAWRLSKNK